MSDERSTDYAVANLKLAIRYIGDNDRPAIRALDLATALDLVESQAADLSRLREERDALTTLAMSFFDPSPCSFDHHGGCQNHTFLDLEPGELCPNEQLRRLPPVAPSPDPNGGEQ